MSVFQDYAGLALLSAAAVYLTNLSLYSVSYTMKIIVKSCRVLPVMALAVGLQGKQYSGQELVSACTLVTGTFLFFAGEWQEAQHGDKERAGTCLLLVALMLDATVVNLEEARFFRKLVPASRAEVMLYLSSFSSIYTLAILAVSGKEYFFSVVSVLFMHWPFRKCLVSHCFYEKYPTPFSGL